MDWRRLDLNGLKVLHALLVEGSVGRSAERLHLTPSAVSHRLHALREYFGDPLFVRTPGGMEPTQRMRDIGMAVTAVVARLEEATGSAFVPSAAQTVFRLIVTESVAATMVPELSNLLRGEAPGCTLFASLYERRDYTNDLLNGVADLVLSVGGHTPPSVGIGVEHLLEDELMVMIGVRSPVWNSPKLAGADYLALSHVYSLPWPTEANHLDQVLARDHKARGIRVFAPSHAIAADIVSATDLALTLPSRVVRHLCRGRDDLRTLSCPFPGAGRISLEWAVDRAKTGRIRFLRDVVARAVDLTTVQTEASSSKA